MCRVPGSISLRRWNAQETKDEGKVSRDSLAVGEEGVCFDRFFFLL
jgi:hypothetical protein